jgi:hypothetical protein
MKKKLIIINYCICALILLSFQNIKADDSFDQGKQIFLGDGNCATCHTLQDANSYGKIGPNLDEIKPSFEELNEETCKWPIGHPYEEKFYFCGRKPLDKFPYCQLHVLYAFQPKNAKEEDQITEEDVPKFIQKKIKSA